MPDAPRRLLLLRHGRTAWNLERRIQGQLDAPLDQVGHTQGRLVASTLAAMRPVALWSSDLSRAADTAAYVGEACGLPVCHDERLREYSLGALQGLTHEEYAASDPDAFDQFRRGHFDIAPDGESTVEVADRMSGALGDLLAATAPGGLAVAVSHGAAIRVGIAAMVGWPLELTTTLGVLDNTAWVVLAESPVTGRLRLAAYNREGDFASAEGVG